MTQHWVYDFETLSNCFAAVFIDSKSDDKRVFVCWEKENQIKELLEFLEQSRDHKRYHISYNGLAFDGQIEQFILDNSPIYKDLSGLGGAGYGAIVAKQIYKFVQNKLISIQNTGGFPPYSPWQIEIPQIDIFKLNHWDNRAKMSSLKWIQYSIDWKNVQEMPIHHTHKVTTWKELSTIIGYCINDVESTKAIFNKSKDLIELRFKLSKEYKLDLLSASETRISKEIFLSFLEKKLGKSKKEIKGYRTQRGIIDFKDIVLDSIQFKTPEFNNVLKWFKSLSIDFSKTTVSEGKGPKYTVEYKDVKTDFALGGIHGCRSAGRYKPQPGWIIMSADVN